MQFDQIPVPGEATSSDKTRENKDYKNELSTDIRRNAEEALTEIDFVLAMLRSREDVDPDLIQRLENAGNKVGTLKRDFETQSHL